MNCITKRLGAPLAIMCLGLPVSMPSFAGLILSPVSVDANIAESVGEELTIDQSGLSDLFMSGVTDFSSYIAGEPTHLFGSPSDSWAAPVENLPGSLDYDLGGFYSITQTALWTSHNGFGIDSFDILVASTVDFGDANLIGSFNAIETPFRFFDAVQLFDTPAVGRYVRLTVNSNHGQGAIGVNLAEIAFNVEPIPVPAPFALILAGIVVLIPYARATNS